MKRIYFFLIFIGVTFTCFNSLGQGQPLFRLLPEFPSFPLISASGTGFSSTKAVKKNKPTVVVYFSPTCHHCQVQTLDITSNYKIFESVQFLFVTNYSPQDTRIFLNENALEKFSNITVGYDTAFAMGRFFDLKSFPGIFIYDEKGKLKNHFETNVKAEKLYGAIFTKEPSFNK